MAQNSDFSLVPIPISPIAHVRKRPGMYFGGTDLRALHHLVYETLDNSAEEAYIGKCSRIELELRANQALFIKDNSDGLPIGQDEASGLSQLEMMLTQFTPKEFFEPNRYTITGGLHGIGLTAVNALSEYLHIEVARDGYLWRQSYRQGIAQSPVEKVRPLQTDEPNGISILFRPDFSIMQANEFDYAVLKKRCQELAYLIGGLEIRITDKRPGHSQTEVFFSEKGLLTLLDEQGQNGESSYRIQRYLGRWLGWFMGRLALT